MLQQSSSPDPDFDMTAATLKAGAIIAAPFSITVFVWCLFLNGVL